VQEQGSVACAVVLQSTCHIISTETGRASTGKGKGVTACLAAWVLLLLFKRQSERHQMHDVDSRITRMLLDGSMLACQQGGSLSGTHVAAQQ
jgi:hypothetical protein